MQASSPYFGNWSRFSHWVTRGVSRAGQQLNTALQTTRAQTLRADYAALRNTREFHLAWGEVLPALIAVSTLLYLYGQEKRQHDETAAPSRQLLEVGAIWALSAHTRNVLPIVSVLAMAYSAGQQGTVLEKIKHIGDSALTVLGSWVGVQLGMGFNLDEWHRDVATTVQLLQEARPHLANPQQVAATLAAWQPEAPEGTADVAAYRAQQRTAVQNALTQWEAHLAGGHQAALDTYHAGVQAGQANTQTLRQRMQLRRQLGVVFEQLWDSLRLAEEPLAHHAQTPPSVLRLVRHLKTINQSYVKALRALNPGWFGVVFSLMAASIIPLWHGVCDGLLGRGWFKGLGAAQPEIPYHRVLVRDQHNVGASAHSATLFQSHLNDRFRAFANVEGPHAESVIYGNASKQLIDQTAYRL
ncbi:MAG: hypothetical protein U0003_01280 [Vampirovibrionales bacterium]